MIKNTFRNKKQLRFGIWNLDAGILRSLVLLGSLLLPLPVLMLSAAAQKPTEPANATALQAAQNVVAKQASLVTEFEVNGLKVLVKRREGSLTVAAGLFIRGGSRNITAKMQASKP